MRDEIGSYKIIGRKFHIKKGEYEGLKIFKSKYLFDAQEDAPCYVPPDSKTVYTRKDFVRICEGNSKLERKLFGELYSCSPEDLLKTMIRQCRVGRCQECNKLIVTRDENGIYEFCDDCGFDIVYPPEE